MIRSRPWSVSPLRYLEARRIQHWLAASWRSLVRVWFGLIDAIERDDPAMRAAWDRFSRRFGIMVFVALGVLVVGNIVRWWLSH